MTHAEQLRDIGIIRSSESAERYEPGWNERAYQALKYFAKVSRIKFTAEDVREWWAQSDMRPINPWSIAYCDVDPPDRRAWGGIFRKAMKQGIIRKVGYTQHRDPKRHAGISTLWETVR